MGAHISANGKPIREIFGVTRRVPAYQRDYSWQPRSQVKNLWEDLASHFSSNPEDDYLLGPVIVTQDATPDIIDGQQRLITLFLLQAAFRYRLLELGGESDFITQVHNDLVEYDEVKRKISARIRHHDPVAEEVLLKIATLIPAEGDARKMRATNRSISARRIVFAFLYLLGAVDELGSDVDTVDWRIRSIRSRVLLIEIATADALQAIYVFERANFRGKPLDPSDLLKNLIFQQFAGDFEELAQEWRILQNTIDETSGVQIMDFLRWYHVGVPGGFYSTARDFVEKVQAFVRNQDALSYVRSMIDSAEALKEMATTSCLRDSKDYSPHLAGIRVMSGGRQRAHWPLMVATSQWSIDARMSLSFELERAIFYSLVCNVPSQDVERSMRAITIRARDGGETHLDAVVSDLRNLAHDYFRKSFFEERFLTLSYEDDSNLVRYALRKIHAGLYREYEGKSAREADAASASFGEAEIEHVWPQADGDALATEDDSALVHRIGNLILLSRAINASGGSQQAKKKIAQHYPQEETKYLIANCLGSRPVTTGRHSHALAIELCPTGFDDWGPEAINRLSHAYLELLRRYIPYPIPPSDGASDG